MIDFVGAKWNCDKNSGVTSINNYDIINDDGTLIATVYDTGSSKDTFKAARLIAAAPKLYHALKFYYEAMRHTRPDLAFVASKVLAEVDGTEEAMS